MLSIRQIQVCQMDYSTDAVYLQYLWLFPPFSCHLARSRGSHTDGRQHNKPPAENPPGVQILLFRESDPGAFEKLIIRQGARDFGLDSVLKDAGILCVFQVFHKPKPGRKIRSSVNNQFRESALLITAGDLLRPEPCPRRCRCT